MSKQVSVLLGPSVPLKYRIHTKIGSICDLRVKLESEAEDMNVRFSFMTEKGPSVSFDTTKDGQIIFPVGVSHHNQTILIPWYETRPFEALDLEEVGAGLSIPHRYEAVGDANVASSRRVRNWDGISAIAEVVFVFNK